jgi:predicted O-methyltransferase YrrM
VTDVVTGFLLARAQAAEAQLERIRAAMQLGPEADLELRARELVVAPYFGQFFAHLQRAVQAGGSELAVGLTLFSLTASIRAKNVCEIGRYRGFSGLALAAGLKLLDSGWCDPDTMHSRPDTDWAAHEGPCVRRCYSIDPNAYVQADELWRRAGVDEYIVRLDKKSDDVVPETDLPPLDLVFVDGSHGYEDVYKDVLRYGDRLRPGGYLVLHDYFGPFERTNNISRVKDIVHHVAVERFKRWVLLDTGYPSMVLMRKPDPAVGGV